MIIQRNLINKIKIFLKRREFIAVIGPRQAGKTTFLEIIREYLLRELKISRDLIQIVTFEDRRLLMEFEADPVSFVYSYFPVQSSETAYFMIDEFQYADEDGQKLKLVYATIRGIKIIPLTSYLFAG